MVQFKYELLFNSSNQPAPFTINWSKCEL